jgi:hypothetical protein
MEGKEPSGLPWQPLTFGGVAGFAHASTARLLAIQAVVASLVAGSVIWLLHHSWEPSFSRAITQLPDRAQIYDGGLQWPAEETVWLSEDLFLSLVVIPSPAPTPPGHVGDLQLEFTPRELRVRSLLGYLPLPYPRGYQISLERSFLEPWWGAWRLPILVAVGAGTILFLLSCWALLAIAYAVVVRTVAFYADRPITTLGSWRVASAALLPGALLMAGAIVAYSLHHISMLQLLVVHGLHLLLGWIYILASPLKLSSDRTEIPFKKPARSRNPFAGRTRRS